MNILAIDPGTRLGWSSLFKGYVESGVHEFRLDRGDSPGIRFLRFRAWLVDMLAMTNPELVVFERPHMRGGYATDLLVGLVTRIQEECAARRIECEAIHSATLKKHATGSGRADKAAMLKSAREEWGKHITDDNEADARWILDWAIKKYAPGEKAEEKEQ